MRSSGSTRTTSNSSGNGSATMSQVSSERTRTIPPRSAAATLSACRPETASSAAMHGSSNSRGRRGEPKRAFVATAAAAAEAALPPWPPERGRPFAISSTRPAATLPTFSRTREAAIPAVLRETSDGISGCPEERIVIPPPGTRSTETVSPAPVSARPRTSRPGPTFATVPGAKARTAFTRAGLSPDPRRR